VPAMRSRKFRPASAFSILAGIRQTFAGAFGLRLNSARTYVWIPAAAQVRMLPVHPHELTRPHRTGGGRRFFIFQASPDFYHGHGPCAGRNAQGKNIVMDQVGSRAPRRGAVPVAQPFQTKRTDACSPASPLALPSRAMRKLRPCPAAGHGAVTSMAMCRHRQYSGTQPRVVARTSSNCGVASIIHRGWDGKRQSAARVIFPCCGAYQLRPASRPDVSRAKISQAFRRGGYDIVASLSLWLARHKPCDFYCLCPDRVAAWLDVYDNHGSSLGAALLPRT